MIMAGMLLGFHGVSQAESMLLNASTARDSFSQVAASSGASIPVPFSLALMGLCLILLGMVLRRIQAKL